MIQRGSHSWLVVLLLCACSLSAQNVIRVQAGTDAPVEYSDFDAGWAYAMTRPEVTITMLGDITRTDRILYQPKLANARAVLDLNNHTITSVGTEISLLNLNKADAILTITDRSSEKGGTIAMTRTCEENIYTVYIQAGELVLTEGKIYCENQRDNEEWHPVCGVYVTSNGGTKFTMTGGTVESYGKYCIFPVYSYGTTDISGGTIKAISNGFGNTSPINVTSGTTTVRGTAHLISCANNSAIGSITSAWVNEDGMEIHRGTLNIEGGTIEVTALEKNAVGIQASAHQREVGGTIHQGHGTVNITGGTITVKCSAPTATQVFAVQVVGSRLFDDATPHHLISEACGEVNISGGTFLVDTRDEQGEYVANGNNIDLLRSWGTLNVSGGTFTIYQHSSATGIGNYRGKTTVSGNPVFHIHCASNARGMVAAPWNHSDYCDADNTKNLAEIEVSGGTFIAQTDSAQGTAMGMWAYGGISTETGSGQAGYAMSGKIIVNGGEFVAIHPTIAYARSIRQDAPRAGAYGTARGSVIVHNGKFKSLAGTYAENTPEGRIVDSQTELTSLHGGYYNTYSQLAPHIDDTCRISELTSADPEYAEGYRYKVEKGPYLVRVTSDEPDRQFASLTRAFNYAQRHLDATITLLDDIDFIGEAMTYNPTPANAKCTLDLNGHSAMMNNKTTTFLFVSKPDALFTIKDSGTGGVFGMTQSNTYAITTWLRQGKMVLESGKIYCDNTNTTQSGMAMRVDANTASDVHFDMNGGTIEAHSMYYAYALLARSASTGTSYATIKGGEIGAYSGGTGALGITAAVGGHVTIEDNPKIIAQNTTTAQAIRTETTGKLIVKGGRMSSNAGRIVAGTDIAITGGYYTERSGSYYKGLVEAFCIPPYHTFPTTPAEQATYGAEYVWKVEPLPESGDYLDIIDVDNENSTMTLNVSDWDVDGWPYTINGTAYAKTDRAAERTMKITYKGNPGDDYYVLVKNKNGEILSHHRYTIPKEVSSATILNSDVGMPVFVNGTTLTINANLMTKNIYVGPNAKLIVNSGKTLDADTIFLRTTPEHAAELRLNGSVSASTKVVYTRIIKSKSGYFQFGLPVTCLNAINAIRLSNGINPDYKAGSGWILRYYDEESRAKNGVGSSGANWRTPDGVGAVIGGRGYEMYSGVNYYREFYFPIDISGLTKDVHVTYSGGSPTDAGWNVLVSPLTETYDNSVVPEGMVMNRMLSDGSFEQEIPSSIPPATVFAFQASAGQTILSFAGSSIVASMPRRVAANEEEQIQWIHLDVKDPNGVGDQTSIYSHPTRYEQSYKTGIDVAKQSLTASRALLYSSHVYGDMAFAGIADSVLEQGVALTVYSPSEQELIISMRENDWLDRMENVWLIDKMTGERIDLKKGSYRLHAAAGTTAGRLVIQGVFRAPQVTTDIENDGLINEGMMKARKVIISDKIYILVNGRMYDSTGRLMR